MGAFDSNPSAEGTSFGRDARTPRVHPQMDGGVGVDNLAERFEGMGVGGNSKESIIQVMKAVDAAENTIKLQLEENNLLKEELMRRTEELKKYKSDATKVNARDEHVGASKMHIFPVEVESERNQWLENNSSSDPLGTVIVHQNGILRNGNSSFQNSAVIQQYSDNRGNGSMKMPSSGQANSYNPGVSQFSPPSSTSISPSRHKKEADYDPLSSSTHGRLPTSEINSSSGAWKHDLILKINEHEEEILRLRRHLADYSMKEAQIHNEKYVLEKRIAHMRMAFDQQQQDLVDAASKALSYRQDIIEENIRLTYALQSAQQERSTFVSSLLPLLSEYGLQPPTSDALSIVGNIKVLFRHLHEKLIITEEKLRESQYQISPWRAEAPNSSNFAPQSPSHSFGVIKNGLEIVPQPPYSHAHSPIASPLNTQTRADWEALGHQTIQTSPLAFASKNLDHENMGSSFPSTSRNPTAEDTPSRAAVAQEKSRVVHFSPETKEQSLSFKDLAGGNELDDSEAGALQAAGESSTQWAGSGSPYLASGLDDQNSSYPYLPPVLEEPSSSFSEAADDDPLPAIEGLQIVGEAYPGRELQACGYSIDGTTTCNFEWVHYLEDGSVNYIEGAKQPHYLVTADDVDFYLAIQVQPLDNRKRNGELVQVFANEQRKISCDPEMQEQIERIYSAGHASFEVSISAGVLNIWEHAVLAIKTEGYSIRCNGPRGVVVAEKFSLTTEIMIPYGQPTEFSIQSASGGEYLLRTSNSDLSRDTIVLTMRLFKMRAVEKRKSKRKGLFFKVIQSA